ncbi:MAG: DUF4190 domain-containing protein [Acidobacteria bacterium]|nr:DUF4190 domain-containing protein [Acidobacteriota bacterium]
MGSVKCANCGFISFADAEHCKRCGGALQLQLHGASGYSPHAAPRFEFGAKPKAGLAVASLVLGVVGFFTFGLLGVGAITGLVLGIVAVARANNRPAEFGGRGAAITGIVLNALALVLVPVVGMVAAVAIPNLIASRRAANEASAIAAVRKLASAEYGYASTAGDGRYADFNELVARGEIAPDLADGENHGYRFDVRHEGGDFEVTAVPVEYPSSGRRSFYFSSSDAFLRAADRRGGKADDSATPLEDMNTGATPAGAN